VLVPYKSDQKQGDAQTVNVRGTNYSEQSRSASNSNFFTKLGLGTSGGCCPGQTGHHLIPDSWAKNANCTNYKEGDAPVVCVEGVSQNDGTHQSVHYNLNEDLHCSAI